jgi:hypothetical protein
MENNIDITAGATIFRGKIFQPTMMLRFVKRSVSIDEHTATKVRVLQQLWADINSKETEWRDVPLGEK